MRIVLYASIAFAIATVGIVRAQSTPEKSIAKQQVSTENKKPNTTDTEHSNPNVAVIANKEAAAAEKCPNATSQEDINIQRKLARFTEWLVIVGIIQAAILCFTVWAISRQTVVARNSERAWMIAHIERATIPDALGTTIIIFSVRVVNKGKTPAFLLEIGNNGIVLPRDESLPDIQPPYKQQNIDTWTDKGLPLQPNAEVIRHNFDTISRSPALLHGGQDFLWIYGYIRYKDAFGKRHETRYCFLWDNMHSHPTLNHGQDEFLVKGPASYIYVS